MMSFSRLRGCDRFGADIYLNALICVSIVAAIGVLYFALDVNIFSRNLGVSMVTNFEVRVLLVMWATDEGSIGKAA